VAPGRGEGLARATRGGGKLEAFLARLRAKKADSLIDSEKRDGRILDIGCGQTPFFLIGIEFAEKFGIEQDSPYGLRVPGVNLVVWDVERPEVVPFRDSSFDVVTMLAVIEHLRREELERIIGEIYRLLVPGGWLVLTTPPPWTDRLLKVLATFGLVSAEEIDEHEHTYTKRDLESMLFQGNFDQSSTRVGYFELGMNIWAMARKPSTPIT